MTKQGIKADGNTIVLEYRSWMLTKFGGYFSLFHKDKGKKSYHTGAWIRHGFGRCLGCQEDVPKNLQVFLGILMRTRGWIR